MSLRSGAIELQRYWKNLGWIQQGYNMRGDGPDSSIEASRTEAKPLSDIL